MLTELDCYGLCFYFYLYAVLGWCAEVAYSAVTKGRFINRGFLYGAYCPIYGCGVLVVLLLLSPVSENFALLFAGSVVLTTAIELLVGIILEQIFHEKWWDYSDVPFNFKGYVCPKFSLLWGFACVFVIRIVHPGIEKLVRMIPQKAGLILLILLYGLFLADVIGTAIALLKLHVHFRTIETIDARIYEISGALGKQISDKTLKQVEKISRIDKKNREIRETLTELRNQLEAEREKMPHRTRNRLKSAFPNLEQKLERHMSDKIRIKSKSKIKNKSKSQ